MHEYDTVLKALLQGSANSVLEQIMGVRVARWLNVELPQVQQTRVDLLGESADDDLIHLELQSTNEPQMPLRMAKYSLRVYRQFQRFPKQIVPYVGDAELRMASELAGPDHFCRYTIVDIRALDSETAAEQSVSGGQCDGDSDAAARPAGGDSADPVANRYTGKRSAGSGVCSTAILAGLRKLEQSIRTEVQFMPIMHDILDHEVIGPAIRRGLEQGRQQGMQQGLEQGMQQGLEQGMQ
jgi:predicted transposase YdaD